MKPFAIFLDDDRSPRQVTWIQLPLVPWTIARDYDIFVSLITKWGLPHYISFDHDLGSEHLADLNEGMKRMLATKQPHDINYDSFKTKTGYHCAKWLIGYCLDNGVELPEYTVHSMNPIGAANITSLLDSFKNRRIK